MCSRDRTDKRAKKKHEQKVMSFVNRKWKVYHFNMFLFYSNTATGITITKSSKVMNGSLLKLVYIQVQDKSYHDSPFTIIFVSMDGALVKWSVL